MLVYKDEFCKFPKINSRKHIPNKELLWEKQYYMSLIPYKFSDQAFLRFYNEKQSFTDFYFFYFSE